MKHQLVELKLQTARTIDLGLSCPDSDAPLDTPLVDGIQLLHCDVRYVLFGANTNGAVVTLESLYVVTGRDFFKYFPKFGGRGLNKKLQIPLPLKFFES